MASVQWKSEKSLKVFGSTIKEGVFRGGHASIVGNGVITRDTPTNFTPEYIEMLYNNVRGHIPFVVEHRNGTTETVGYTYKMGVTPAMDDLKFQGFVFNETAKDKIIKEGYTFVSPEIVEETDSSGNVTDARIVKIAFVRNPAIEGTDIGIEPIVFSKGDEGMTDNPVSNVTTPSQTVVTPNTTGTPPTGFGTPVQPAVRSGNDPIDVRITVDSARTQDVPPKQDPPAVDPPAGNDVSNAKPMSLEEHNQALAAKIESLLTERYDGIVAELKRQGIEDPGAIVRGLPVEQKISVLSKMKDTVVKTKPIAGPVDTPVPPPNSQSKVEIDKAVSEVLAEIGYTDDEYKHLRGEK